MMSIKIVGKLKFMMNTLGKNECSTGLQPLNLHCTRPWYNQFWHVEVGLCLFKQYMKEDCQGWDSCGMLAMF